MIRIASKDVCIFDLISESIVRFSYSLIRDPTRLNSVLLDVEVLTTCQKRQVI